MTVRSLTATGLQTGIQSDIWPSYYIKTPMQKMDVCTLVDAVETMKSVHIFLLKYIQ